MHWDETITARIPRSYFSLFYQWLLSLSPSEASWLERAIADVSVHDHHLLMNLVLQDSWKILAQLSDFVKMKNVLIKPYKKCITKQISILLSFHYDLSELIRAKTGSLHLHRNFLVMNVARERNLEQSTEKFIRVRKYIILLIGRHYRKQIHYLNPKSEY